MNSYKWYVNLLIVFVFSGQLLHGSQEQQKALAVKDALLEIMRKMRIDYLDTFDFSTSDFSRPEKLRVLNLLKEALATHKALSGSPGSYEEADIEAMKIAKDRLEKEMTAEAESEGEEKWGAERRYWPEPIDTFFKILRKIDPKSEVIETIFASNVNVDNFRKLDLQQQYELKSVLSNLLIEDQALFESQNRRALNQKMRDWAQGALATMQTILAETFYSIYGSYRVHNLKDSITDDQAAQEEQRLIEQLSETREELSRKEDSNFKNTVGSLGFDEIVHVANNLADLLSVHLRYLIYVGNKDTHKNFREGVEWRLNNIKQLLIDNAQKVSSYLFKLVADKYGGGAMPESNAMKAIADKSLLEAVQLRNRMQKCLDMDATFFNLYGKNLPPVPVQAFSVPVQAFTEYVRVLDGEIERHMNLLPQEYGIKQSTLGEAFIGVNMRRYRDKLNAQDGAKAIVAKFDNKVAFEDKDMAGITVQVIQILKDMLSIGLRAHALISQNEELRKYDMDVAWLADALKVIKFTVPDKKLWQMPASPPATITPTATTGAAPPATPPPLSPTASSVPISGHPAPSTTLAPAPSATSASTPTSHIPQRTTVDQPPQITAGSPASGGARPAPTSEPRRVASQPRDEPAPPPARPAQVTRTQQQLPRLGQKSQRVLDIVEDLKKIIKQKELVVGGGQKDIDEQSEEVVRLQKDLDRSLKKQTALAAEVIEKQLFVGRARNQIHQVPDKNSIEQLRQRVESLPTLGIGSRIWWWFRSWLPY